LDDTKCSTEQFIVNNRVPEVLSALKRWVSSRFCP